MTIVLRIIAIIFYLSSAYCAMIENDYSKATYMLLTACISFYFAKEDDKYNF